MKIKIHENNKSIRSYGKKDVQSKFKYTFFSLFLKQEREQSISVL